MFRRPSPCGVDGPCRWPKPFAVMDIVYATSNVRLRRLFISGIAEEFLMVHAWPMSLHHPCRPCLAPVWKTSER